jgi:hypothetical protein
VCGLVDKTSRLNGIVITIILVLIQTMQCCWLILVHQLILRDVHVWLHTHEVAPLLLGLPLIPLRVELRSIHQIIPTIRIIRVIL